MVAGTLGMRAKTRCDLMGHMWLVIGLRMGKCVFCVLCVLCVFPNHKSKFLLHVCFMCFMCFFSEYINKFLLKFIFSSL